MAAATASRDKVQRRAAQAQQHADSGGKGGIGLLLLVGGVAALGVYELTKGKSASPTAAGTAACSLAPGTIVRDPVNGGEFLVNGDGTLSRIATAQVLAQCFPNAQIVEASTAAFAGCSFVGQIDGSNGCSPGAMACGQTAGTLIQDISNGGIYYVNPNGQLNHITSPQVLAQCFPNTPVVTVAHGAIANCTIGPDISGC